MMIGVRSRARERVLCAAFTLAAAAPAVGAQAIPVGTCTELPVRLERGQAVDLDRAILVSPADWRFTLGWTDWRPTSVHAGLPTDQVAYRDIDAVVGIDRSFETADRARLAQRPLRTPSATDATGDVVTWRDDGADAALRYTDYTTLRDRVGAAAGASLRTAVLRTPRGAVVRAIYADDGAAAIGAPVPTGSRAACTATVAGTSVRIVRSERARAGSRAPMVIHEIVARPPGEQSGASIVTGVGLTDDELRAAIAMALGTRPLESRGR